MRDNIKRRLDALESRLSEGVVGVLFDDSETGRPGVLVRVAGALLPEAAFRDRYPRATLIHIRYTDQQELDETAW